MSACTDVEDATIPSPTPSLSSTVAPTRMTSSATPTRPLPTPGPTHVPSATPFPAGKPSGRLHLDVAQGSVYASSSHGDAAWLWVFDAESGELNEGLELLPSELLFHIESDQRELYVHSPKSGDVRVLHADSLAPLRIVTLPTTYPTDTLTTETGWGRKLSAQGSPVVDQLREQILGFYGGRLLGFDLLTGERRREDQVHSSIPLGMHSKLTALDKNGRFLYRADRNGPQTWVGTRGTNIAAIDRASGTVSGASGHDADILLSWLPWDDGLVVSLTTHKELCCRHRAWSGGVERRKLTEFAVRWQVYDSRRDRLIGATGDLLAIADPRTLTLQAVSARPNDFEPVAYDEATDRFYAWSADFDSIQARSAESLYSVFEAPVQEYPGERTTAQSAFYPSGTYVGQAALQLSTLPKDSDPVSGSSSREALAQMPVARSREGEPWYRIGLPSMHPHNNRDGLTLSPNFENDRTMFRHPSGLGVLRSEDAGRSWKPASAGMDAMGLMSLAISPDFSQDRRLMATTFTGFRSENWPIDDPPSYTETHDPAPDHDVMTAWRSGDAGESWRSLGRYSALTFSPTYAQDGEVYGFEYLGPRFVVSTDFGSTWTLRGRLPDLMYERFVGSRIWVIPSTPEHPRVLLALAASDAAMGGSAQWPIMGSRLFRSIDGGYHWDLAWESKSSPRSAGEVVILPQSARLFGPLSDGVSPSWLISLKTHIRTGPIFLTSQDGTRWFSRYISGHSDATVLAVHEDGRIVIRDPVADETIETLVEDLSLGWPQ